MGESRPRGRTNNFRELGQGHWINIYIEEKATKIVFQIGEFHEFWPEFIRFYIVHSVYSVRYGAQIPPHP